MALICHTVDAFAQVREIDELVVVVHAKEMEMVRQRLQPITDQIRLVQGGETRRDSALAGVRASGGDWVLIHDGARPFPSAELILRVLARAGQENAAIPVLPVTDFLHHLGTSGCLEEPADLNTHSLVQAQTPQGFQRAWK